MRCDYAASDPAISCDGDAEYLVHITFPAGDTVTRMLCSLHESTVEEMIGAAGLTYDTEALETS